LKPKHASRDVSELAEAISLNVQYILFALEKRMPSISAPSLRIPVRCPTLISLDFSLASLIGIAGKRKKLLTCT
jgi:hypothetical protein